MTTLNKRWRAPTAHSMRPKIKAATLFLPVDLRALRHRGADKTLPCRLQATNISNHYHLDLYLEIEWHGVPFLSAMNLSGGLLCRRLSMPRRRVFGKNRHPAHTCSISCDLTNPPRHALTLAEWSQPIALRSLLATVRSYLSSSADAASGTEASALALGAMVYRPAGAAADAGAAQ